MAFIWIGAASLDEVFEKKESLDFYGLRGLLLWLSGADGRLRNSGDLFVTFW